IKKIQKLPLLPEAFEGENTAAEVAVSEDGKFLYASNRGDDSIVSFEIDGEGKLHSPEFTSSGGEGPRHLTLVPGGGWIICANDKSDSLTVLELAHGRPVAMAHELKTTSPVRVTFVTLTTSMQSLDDCPVPVLHHSSDFFPINPNSFRMLVN